MGRGYGPRSTEVDQCDLGQLLPYMFLMKEENVHLLSSCTHSATPEVCFVQAWSIRNSFFVIFLKTSYS